MALIDPHPQSEGERRVFNPALARSIGLSEAIAVQYASEVCREWGERRVGPDGIERRWLRLEMDDWERALNWWPRKKARRAICSLIVRGYMQAQIFEVNHIERRKAWFAVCEEKLKEESLRPSAQRLKKKGGSNGTDNVDESGASASSDIDWADRIEAGGPDRPVTPTERIEAITKEMEQTDASSLDPDKANWFAKCTKPDPPNPLDPPPGFMAVNPWTRNAHPSGPIPDFAEVLGIKRAIALHRFHHGIRRKGEWRMGPDGKWRGWVRIPAGVVEHELLSFWHSETIGKVMVNLTEEEYLIPFSFEKDRGDQSFWYAVNYEKIATLPIESDREEMAPFGSGGVPGRN